MRTTLLAVALVCGSALAVHAESFTFTATSTVANQINAQVTGGKPVLAVFITGVSHITYDSGKKGD